MGKRLAQFLGFLSAILLAAVLFCSCATTPGQPTQEKLDSPAAIKWRMVTISGWVTPQQTDELIAKIRDRSGGRLIIQRYRPADLYFSGPDTLQYLEKQLIEIGAATNDTPGYPWLQLQTLPYFLQKHDMAIYKAFAEAQCSLVTELYESCGAKVITPKGMPGNPSRIVLQTKKPIPQIQDLMGMKIWIDKPNIQSQTSMCKAMGINRISLPITDLYLSIQTNLVNGAITLCTVAKSYSLHEVGKYFIGLWPTFSTAYYGAVKVAFDKLPADIQSVLLDCFDEYSDSAWKSVIPEKSDNDWEAFVKEKSVNYARSLPPEDEAVFIKIARSSWLAEVQKAGAQGERWLDIYEKVTGNRIRKQ